MNCPVCNMEIENIKKWQVVECSCGASLLCIEVNKVLTIENVSKSKEDKND